MFTIDDFWELFNYIYKNETGNDIDTNVDSNIKPIALSELSKSKILFEETLDQITFSSQDYRRLRSFLINWYATNRTIIKIQQDAPNLFFLPDKHLDELFKSFGFDYSYSIRDFETKVNFFLDLVNLYKIKGTPISIIKALDYFGIKNSILNEYFLKKDQNGDLIFEAKPIFPSGTVPIDLELSSIYFSNLVQLDPHWFQSESDILSLINTNKISLPSKTPYFGIRPSYEFKSIEPVLNYFHRLMQDYIGIFKTTGVLQERNINLEELNLVVSIPELFLAVNYCFGKVYGYSPFINNSLFVVNNTTVTDSYSDFRDIYDSIVYSNPEDREDQRLKINEFKDKLTRPINTEEIGNFNDIFTLLEQMNSNLSDEINIRELGGRLRDLTPKLVKKLNDWLEINIDVSFPDLSVLTLGFDGLLDVTNVIDFFKPKRARFLAMDILYKFQNRLFDSMKFEETLNYELTQYFRLHGKPKQPACEYGYNDGMIYDCGHSFDVGLMDDDFEMIITYDGGDDLTDNMTNIEKCEETYEYDMVERDFIDPIAVTSTTNFYANYDDDEFTYDVRENCRQEVLTVFVE